MAFASEELHSLDVDTLGVRLRGGELTSRQLTEHCLARVGKLDSRVHAFVLVTADRALADAERADRELAAGIDRGPLHGIPYAVKDIFDTKGIGTTSHSWLRVDHVPASDSTVVRRMSDAGAVLIGKLGTHEFALGGPSQELPFPPVRNPWNLEHVPGASSSGSAAAVAAGFVRIALGSDTTGSIRGPAFHCGVVGLKPTYGLVSRFGVFPLSYSLDHCGPLTRTAREAATVLSVIEGVDPDDPGSVRRPAAPSAPRRALRVGWTPKRLRAQRTVHPEVWDQLTIVLRHLRELGAEVVTVDLPDLAVFGACGRVIMAAEAFAVHQDDIRSRPREFGRYTYQRVAAGATVLASDLVLAHQTRRRLAEAVDRVFADCDVLVEPSALAPAARFDAFGHDWPPPAAANATQTVEFNVSGHPALALPTGLSSDGLPLGVQLVGPYFSEDLLTRLATELESRLDILSLRPAGFE
ncbi:amidase [Streptomyces sp. NPDC050619]|uniref:amidase n=1 Tax=Streptomyces sp. NPDC050619 TaxID=3157214 RepID=UPI00342D7764